MAIAPAAGAVTVTPLGQCTAPKPPNPNLERLSVPGTVKVGADGRPTGASVGVSVRNSTSAYQGSGVDLQVAIVDASSGRAVGTVTTLSWGCERYLWSLREATTAATPTTSPAPMKLRRGKLYAVVASGVFIDTSGGGATPWAGLAKLLTNPTAWFITV